jgi:succinoglycan biosynthesis protein ExoM
MRLVAVCIATYHRPDMLEKLLLTLRDQVGPEDCALEFRLVDNDAAGSARAVAEKWAGALPGPLRYEIEPRQGISAARNHALDMGPADLFASIDDDETAAPRWLVELVSTLDRTQADAVFGPVLGTYPAGSPAWLVRGRFFDRQVGADGRRLLWKETRTGNTLVRGTWFTEKGFRYASDYGRSGGEDTQLFARMGLEGAVFRASARAMVREEVPLERTRLRWLWRSAWLKTISYHRTLEAHARGSRPMLAVSILRILRALCLSLVALPLLLVGRREHLYGAVLKWASAGAGIEYWLMPSRASGYVAYGPK